MPSFGGRAPGTAMRPIPGQGQSRFGRSGGSAVFGGGVTQQQQSQQQAATAGPAAGPLTITAQASPEMTAALAEWKKRQAALEAEAGAADPNLQFQIDKYKERLGAEPTQRAIDRAASGIRDQMAGLNAGAEVTGSMTGRGQGYGASQIAEAGQRQLAAQSANIVSNRERDLDALTMAGQGLMAAPGQRSMAYQQMLNQGYSQNPLLDTANLGLAQQGLGLQAWIAQQNAQNQAAQLQAQRYGSPADMFRILYGG